MKIYRPRYKDRHGKVRQSNVWRVRYFVDGVRHDDSTRLRDRNAARAAAARLMKDAQLKAAGIETHRPTREAPVKALVDEYRGELLRRGRTEEHADLTKTRVLALIGDRGTLAECTPERVRLGLERLAARPKRTPTARTLNVHRVALNGFFRWLMREGRWHENPVACTSPVAPQEPKDPRRAMTLDELNALLVAAPPERRIVYRFAASTGLRRKEIRSLVWSDLDLKAKTLLCRASTTKSKKEARLPLTVPGIATALVAWRKTCGPVLPSAPVFPQGVPDVDTLREDLTTAGVEHRNAQGKIDFHALRSTYGTMLCRAGVPLATAQKLCRHSTPYLTARYYVRLELSDLAAAAARMPDVGATRRRRRARKSGS